MTTPNNQPELKQGDCSQFIDNDGYLCACRIRHRFGRHLGIDYRTHDGKNIRGAVVSICDLVSDEDVATHDIP